MQDPQLSIPNQDPQNLQPSIPNPASPVQAPVTLQTLKGEITYSEAADREENVLQRLTYWDKRTDLIIYLLRRTQEIEAIVSCYLRLTGTEKCRLASSDDWVHGSFNICIPVYVDNWRRPGRRVMIRFPMPFKVGELHYPGNADEKVRSEAATYAWIRENCPNVPVPYLWGFAFAGSSEGAEGSSFIALDNASLFTRFFEGFRRRIYSLLGLTVPCRYIPSGRPYDLNIGHLVIDYIEESDGRMLSKSWESQRHDDRRRANLFRDLSRVMLELGNISLPRIGSFTMDNKGVISLTNRPLNCQIHQLENQGVPTDISRDTTYLTTESYLLDVLACHDSHLTHQQNAVNDEEDCRAQMATLAAFRAVLPRFIRRDLRHGPFLLTLTDLHQSNIFVDDEWNIKYLIDLEWACSLPIEMQHPPYWLTSQSVDRLYGEQRAPFEEAYKEFLDIFTREESQLLPATQPTPLLRSCTMKRGWESGNFFYFLALDSISGLYHLFLQHIQDRFDLNVDYTVFERTFSPYWGLECTKFVTAKLEQKREYDRRLAEAFGKSKDD